MTMMKSLCTAGLMVALASSIASAATPITTGSLVREMIDMHALAEFPDPSFKTIQFSSYDRRSNLPGGPNWFSNSDGFGGEPIPNFEAVLEEPGDDGVGRYLICDVEGPGAIVRVWTAAINGTITMRLDGAETPVYEGSADDFLRRPYNVFAKQIEIDPALFDGAFNQQNAAYCPIPFAKRCRIEWTGELKKLHFYEVQVRLYEDDAEVETFTPEDLKTYAVELERTARILRNPEKEGPHQADRPGVVHETFEKAVIPAGRTHDLYAAEGEAGVIEYFAVTVDGDDLDAALRQTILHIHFDGAQHAQVEAPIGDFFGAAPGINPYDSVPFTVTPDGIMSCRYVMPYADSVRIRLENKGDQDVRVIGSLEKRAYRWDENRSMHFRAKWRVDHDLIADPAAPMDIPFIIAHGKGRYVGTTSIMMNPADVPTPHGGWWGEGDEKIFIDDDIRPGTYGTGSEDYYNYAWSIPDIFLWAYCGQPRNDGPGNRGFVTNFRWHILDSLPFKERCAFFMELWHHKRTPGFSYARIAYWYARPGAIDDHLPITGEDVRTLELPPNWTPFAGWGSHNCMFYEPRDMLANTSAKFDIIEDNLHSAGRMMQWTPHHVGDQIIFAVPIEEAGTYRINLCCLKSPDSSRVRLWIDDREGDAVEANLRVDHRRLMRKINGPELELEAGERMLHVQSLDEETKEIGIDFIWVRRK